MRMVAWCKKLTRAPGNLHPYILFPDFVPKEGANQDAALTNQDAALTNQDASLTVASRWGGKTVPGDNASNRHTLITSQQRWQISSLFG